MNNTEQGAPEELALEAKAICEAVVKAGQTVALGQLASVFLHLTNDQLQGMTAVDAETLLVDTVQRMAHKLGILP